MKTLYDGFLHGVVNLLKCCLICENAIFGYLWGLGVDKTGTGNDSGTHILLQNWQQERIRLNENEQVTLYF